MKTPINQLELFPQIVRFARKERDDVYMAIISLRRLGYNVIRVSDRQHCVTRGSHERLLSHSEVLALAKQHANLVAETPLES